MKTSKKTLSFILFTLCITFIFGTDSYAQKSSKEVSYKTVKLKAAVACSTCKGKIEKALAYEKGVKEATASIETKIVTVKYRTDKTNPQKIEKVIDDLGYNASIVTSNASCDKKSVKCKDPKPGCCKKQKK